MLNKSLRCSAYGRWLFCALVMLGGDAIGAADPVAGPAPFTVMTWNVEWFYDEFQGDNYSDLAKEKSAPSRQAWDWHRDAVAASIAKASPSICALQEVENRRVLWYLTRALAREHSQKYQEVGVESKDVYTEQDVGFLFRPPVEIVQTSVFSITSAMRASEQYFDLTKHVVGVFEVPIGPTTTERVTVMNVHLRATDEAEAIRIRQCRLLYLWLESAIARGENVIVLGDFNTETRASDDEPRGGMKLRDMHVARGFEQPDPAKRLVDLHRYIPAEKQQTHLLPGRSFDRILVTPALIEDDPSRADLVFRSIEVRSDLAIQGDLDRPEEHWENYWAMPANERDLSDHFPLIATFAVE